MPDATEPERATACGLLLREGRLLLERRPATARVYPGLWDTPGGHLEPGEAPEAAFLREMGEELGIRPTGYRLLAVEDDRDPATGARGSPSQASTQYTWCR